MLHWQKTPTLELQKKNRNNDHLRLFLKLREGKKKEKIDKKERKKGRKEEKDILPVKESCSPESLPPSSKLSFL